jgi:hypothetical protein
MGRLKLILIRLADWLDDRILQHSFPRICQWVGLSDWWGYDNSDLREMAKRR